MREARIVGDVRHYRDLVVWQNAVKLVSEVYRITRSFPPDERFGLTAQIGERQFQYRAILQRAKVDVRPASFRHFLGNARGSLLERETQLIIARNLSYLSEPSSDVFELIAEVGRDP